jgi:hypothetical protein
MKRIAATNSYLMFPGDQAEAQVPYLFSVPHPGCVAGWNLEGEQSGVDSPVDFTKANPPKDIFMSSLPVSNGDLHGTDVHPIARMQNPGELLRDDNQLRRPLPRHRSMKLERPCIVGPRDRLEVPARLEE